MLCRVQRKVVTKPIDESLATDCCGVRPTIWAGCDAAVMSECCRGCMEKIECSLCDRIVWGWDLESIKLWNSGGGDD